MKPPKITKISFEHVVRSSVQLSTMLNDGNYRKSISNTILLSGVIYDPSRPERVKGPFKQMAKSQRAQPDLEQFDTNKDLAKFVFNWCYFYYFLMIFKRFRLSQQADFSKVTKRQSLKTIKLKKNFALGKRFIFFKKNVHFANFQFFSSDMKGKHWF